MAGEKISQLPGATPQLTDIYPAVQGGVTSQETLQNLLTLFLANLGTASIPSLTVTGNITAGTLTFSPTTGGIIGTTTNDNAAAGEVGEYIHSSILIGSAVSLTTNTPANITSISLTAGDWDCRGLFVCAPAMSTVTQGVIGSISTVSATLPVAGAENNISIVYPNNTGGDAPGFPVGPMRISLSGTTTVYLVGSVSFTVSTMGGYGFIGARRIR